MPKISVTVPHNHNPQEVISKAAKSIEDAAREFQATDIQVATTGNTANFSFRALAFVISGRLEARPKDVLVEVELPMLAMAFKEMAEETIRENLEKALAIEGPK